MTVWILAFIIIGVGVVLHLYFRCPKLIKDDHMTEDPYEDSTDPRALAHSAIITRTHSTPSPPEHSVNDVHELRAQDQSIAQLVTQYHDMAGSPWKIEIAIIEGAALEARSSLAFNSWVLGQMMTPIASKGAQRGTSSSETLYYLTVSSNKVTAETSKRADELLTKLNSEYFSAVSKRRTEVLAALANTTYPLPPERPSQAFVVSCGQTKVAFESRADAEALLAQLNKQYAETVHDELVRVLQEIKEAASA